MRDLQGRSPLSSALTKLHAPNSQQVARGGQTPKPSLVGDLTLPSMSRTAADAIEAVFGK